MSFSIYKDPCCRYKQKENRTLTHPQPLQTSVLLSRGMSTSSWDGHQPWWNGDSELAEEQPVQNLVLQPGLWHLVSGLHWCQLSQYQLQNFLKKFLCLEMGADLRSNENINSLASYTAYSNGAFHFCKHFLVLPKELEEGGKRAQSFKKRAKYLLYLLICLNLNYIPEREKFSFLQSEASCLPGCWCFI